MSHFTIALLGNHHTAVPRLALPLSVRSLFVLRPLFQSDGRAAVRCIFSSEFYTRMPSCQMGESSSQYLGEPWIAGLLAAAGLASGDRLPEQKATLNMRANSY
jgi:hypothetical protein